MSRAETRKADIVRPAWRWMLIDSSVRLLGQVMHGSKMRLMQGECEAARLLWEEKAIMQAWRRIQEHFGNSVPYYRGLSSDAVKELSELARWLACWWFGFAAPMYFVGRSGRNWAEAWVPRKHRQKRGVRAHSQSRDVCSGTEYFMIPAVCKMDLRFPRRYISYTGSVEDTPSPASPYALIST